MLLSGFQWVAPEEEDRTGLFMEAEMKRVLSEGTWVAFSLAFDPDEEVSKKALFSCFVRFPK
jgi:hypothetical protein